jgi:hypothetical protein
MLFIFVADQMKNQPDSRLNGSFVSVAWQMILLIVSAAIFPVASVHATSMAPYFDFNESPDRAKFVLNLTFDQRGGYSVSDVRTEGKPAPAQLQIKEKWSNEQNLTDTRVNGQKPSGMIVFLKGTTEDGKWWFNHEEAVYFFKEKVRFNGIPRPEFTPETFLAELKQAISTQTQLAHLVATPPSREKLAKLVSFLIVHEKPADFEKPRARRTLFRTVSGSLRNQKPEAQAWVVEALSSARSEREQTILIDLIAGLPPEASAIEAVVGFLDRTHPSKVRRSAILTLYFIDSFRALGLFIPYLTMDDPELLFMLAVPYEGLDLTPAVLRNPKAFQPLSNLYAASKEAATTLHPDKSKFINAVVETITNYGHPRHFPLILDWVMNKNSAGYAYAPTYLSHFTGIQLRPNKVESWLRWWESNKSLLEPAYDLQSPVGRKAWMEAWNRADRDVRKILLKLWTFEPVPDQNGLVEEALTNEAARQVLARLWSEKRLSGDTRKSIARNHLTFHLERTPTALDKRLNGFFSVRIAARSSFPFPPGAIVNYRDGVSLNHPPDPGKYNSSFSLADVTEMNYESLTVSQDDPAPVNAVVQMREFGDPSNQREFQWELEWQLDPFTLNPDQE